MERLFELNRNGKELLGIIHFPDRKVVDEPSPCVIMCYGFNGNRRETNRISVKFARRLAEKGIACVRFDYIGCGISAGDFYQSTIENRVNDVKEVIHFVSSLPLIQKKSIHLVGFSDGCRVVLNVALDLLNEIRSISLWSPILIDEKADEQMENEGNIPKLVRNKISGQFFYSYLGLWVHPNYFNPLHDIYVNKMKQVLNVIPSLSVLGGNDPRNKDTRKWIASINQHPKLSIHQIDGAGHLFESRGWIESLLNETIRFIQHCNAKGRKWKEGVTS